MCECIQVYIHIHRVDPYETPSTPPQKNKAAAGPQRLKPARRHHYNWFKGALQLLSKRSKQICFAIFLERMLFSSSDGDHQYPEFTHETRNDSEQMIQKSKLRPSFIMSHITKVISHQYSLIMKKLLRFT